MLKTHRIAGILVMIVMAFALVSPVSCAKQAPGEAADKSAVASEPAANATDAEAGEVLAKATAAPAKTAAGQQQANEPARNPVKVLMLDSPAPEFNLTDSDGKKITLGQFKGKTVVLAFWRPDLDICIQQLKQLESIISEKKLDVVVVAASPRAMKDQDGKDVDLVKAAAKTMKENNLAVKVAFDTDSMDTVASYEVGGVPYYALIDRDGNTRMAGSFLVKQKMNTLTFSEMVEKVAKGGKIPGCEVAPTGSAPKYAPLVGTMAPDFFAKDLFGEDQSLKFYKGLSKVLVVFWSPYCGHCQKELPRLEVFHRYFAKEKNIFVLGLPGYPEEEDKKVEHGKLVDLLLKRLDITFPNIPDYNGRIADSFKIEGVPSLFIIGKDGKIEEAYSGELLFTAESLSCVLDRLKGGDGKDE